MAAPEDPVNTAPDASFSVVRHGFDKTQVRRHIELLAEITTQAESDRDEARTQVAELRGELEIARREITALAERLDAIDNGDGGTARLLSVARSQASEITARAQVAAEQSWSGAEKASAALRDRYRQLLADLEKQHSELTTTHKSIMSTTKSQVSELTTEAERRRREIDKEAERDRVRIDREFSESMSTKRGALERELAAAREASAKEVEERLRAADVEAKRRVDSVTEQVKQLSAVRAQLAEQLRGTRELFDRSAALLEPVDKEEELTADDRLPMPDPPRDQQRKRTVPPQREKRTQPAKR